MKSATTKAVLLGATVLATSATAMPAMAQDIIVTAQRTEQRLQDVPISITVFNQEELDKKNILNAKDIATFTPGVYAQTRFGNDTTTYTIRGFTQEQRTTATVGTYFAEVVAPRGNGVSQGGDGASPGALFDLEAVEVLKGPQGTLFGRNTTGGAVLLRPVKPKDELEGYVEGTVGNFNRWRVQGVVNLPISDTFRIRLGADRHKRDGYIKNIGVSALHDEDMGSIDITSFRASAVWDITENIENYTIFNWSESKSSGAIPLIKRVFTDQNDPALNCDATEQAAGLCPLSFAGLAGGQVAREAAAGMGWWTGTNSNPQGEAYFKEMRIINRTSFQLSDSLELVNLFGYSEIKGTNAVDAFGLNAQLAPVASGQSSFFSFVPISGNPDFRNLTANQRSVVEELRLVGDHGRLNWQAGLYYEKSSPKDFTGTLTPTAGVCFDIPNFQCANSSGASISANKVWNRSIAAYLQATYDITEQLAITGGIRWTEDKTRAEYMNGRVLFSPATGWTANTFRCQFPGLPDSGMTFPNTSEVRASRCFLNAETKTSAPTWTLNLEYKPMQDILVYAKWSRGYRQGSLVPPAPPGLEPYGEEKVDLYEIGAKTSWYGSVPGRFNIAAFYNDFRGQQIQAGINNADLTIQTTAIINADKSYTAGIEADVMVEPTDWFRLTAAYSYNKTKLKSIVFPDLSSIGLIVRELEVGGPIPLAVPHAFNATASLMLPLPESIGDIELSGTIVHMSSFRAVADGVPGSGLGILPKRTFGNVNLSWKNIGGGPVDALFSVTNVTNEKMFTHINEQSGRGFTAYSVDEPRQYMMRIKYRFGGLAD